MSSRIFQSVIMQIKEATDRCIGIIDDQGFVITCSELPMIGSRLDDFSSMNYDFSEPVLVSSMRTYKVLSNSSGKFDYAHGLREILIDHPIPRYHMDIGGFWQQYTY